MRRGRGVGATEPTPVLVTVDVQTGMDSPYWGRRNNAQAEANMARLHAAFRREGQPLVHVRHSSRNPSSPLAPGSPGVAFKREVMPAAGEVVLTKNVNSAFIGTDLERILRDLGAAPVVVIGLTTCHCVSSTIRMAANLGFDVVAVEDAMAEFDLPGRDGAVVRAEVAHEAELAALRGEFARIVTTSELLAEL